MGKMFLLTPIRDRCVLRRNRRCARENCQSFVAEGHRALLTSFAKKIRWNNKDRLNVILLLLARHGKIFAVCSFSWHN